MFSGFQTSGYQRNAYQIVTGQQVSTADTHDGAIRYRERLRRLANARSEFEAAKNPIQQNNVVVIEEPQYKESIRNLALLLLMSW